MAGRRRPALSSGLFREAEIFSRRPRIMKKYLSVLALVLLATAPAYGSVIGDLEMLGGWVLELEDEADALGVAIENIAEDIAFLRGRGKFTYEIEELARRAYELDGDILDLEYDLGRLSESINRKWKTYYGGGTVTAWEVESLERLAGEYEDELYYLEIRTEQLDDDVAWLYGRMGVWRSSGCDSLGLGMGALALAGLALIKKSAGGRSMNSLTEPASGRTSSAP
jgi:hypothetical protein